MKYTFQTACFPSGKKILRIHFDESIYEGLERFFNDDAPLLADSLPSLLEEIKQEKRKTVELAGNRTLLTLTKEIMTLEDQLDHREDAPSFLPLTLQTRKFEKLWNNWSRRQRESCSD